MAIARRTAFSPSQSLLSRLQALVLHIQRCNHSSAGDSGSPGSQLPATDQKHQHVPSFCISTAKTLDSRALGINGSSVSWPTWKLLDVLRKSGFEAYLVGGCVRDLLLKKTPKDFDVITTASLEQIRDRFRRSRIVGRRFPICHVHLQNSMTEVSSFSTIKKNVADRPPIYPAQLANDCYMKHFVRWNDSLRRDFTINCLFYDPFVNQVYDYVDGIQDLRISKVRTVIPAHLSLKEDCARILRGFRIAARLGLQFCEEMTAAIRDLSSSLLTIEKEKLMTEMHYMLGYGAAESSLCLLMKYKLLELLLPLHASYLEDQTRKGSAESCTMLMKLFSNVDKLLAADRPSDRILWIALLAFHLALIHHPQDARVVWTLSSVLYDGTWRKAVTSATESFAVPVEFSPEICVCSSTKSADSLLDDASHFASLIQQSIIMLTNADAAFQCLNDPIRCSGLVFVSPKTGKSVKGLFDVLAKNIRSYDSERKTSKINYDLLKTGDPSETLFVFGKIIMDTIKGEDVHAHELDLEVAAKENNLHELARKENKNPSSVEKSMHYEVTHENPNMAAVDGSVPTELTRKNKRSRKRNQNMHATKISTKGMGEQEMEMGPTNKSKNHNYESTGKSTAAKEVYKCSGENRRKYTDDQDQKVQVEKKVKHYSEHNQKVDASMKTNKSYGKKDQKVIADRKKWQFTNEVTHENPSMAAVDGSGPAELSRKDKRSRKRNQIMHATKISTKGMGDQEMEMGATNKSKNHNYESTEKSIAAKEVYKRSGEKRRKYTDDQDQKVQVEKKVKHYSEHNQKVDASMKTNKSYGKKDQKVITDRKKWPLTNERHQKVGAANKNTRPNRNLSVMEKSNLGERTGNASQNVPALEKNSLNGPAPKQIQKGASLEKTSTLSSLFK